MDEQYRIVLFDEYCDTCKYKDTGENDIPCDECLSHPINLYSFKPVKYEEKEES